MKALIIAIWLYCPAGPADYAIYVSSLEACEQMAPAIMEGVREEMMAGGAVFQCRFKEEPPPEEACWS